MAEHSASRVNRPLVFNHNLMLREIRDNLKHLRREPENINEVQPHHVGNQAIYRSNNLNPSPQNQRMNGRYSTQRNNLVDQNRGRHEHANLQPNYDESGYSSSSSECSMQGANDLNGLHYVPENVEGQNILSPSNFDFARAMANNNGFQRINPNAGRNRQRPNLIAPIPYTGKSPPPYSLASQKVNRAYPENQSVATHRTSKTETSKYMQTTALPSGNKMISQAEWKVTSMSNMPGKGSSPQRQPMSVVPEGAAMWTSTPFSLTQKVNPISHGHQSFHHGGYPNQTTSPQFQVQVSLNPVNGTHVPRTTFPQMVSNTPGQATTFQVSVQTSPATVATEPDPGSMYSGIQQSYGKTDMQMSSLDSNYNMLHQQSRYIPREEYEPPPYHRKKFTQPPESYPLASQVCHDQSNKSNALNQWTCLNAPQSDNVSMSSDDSRASTIEDADFSGFDLACLTSFDGMDDDSPSVCTNDTGTLVVHVRKRPENDVPMSNGSVNGEERSQRPHVSPQTYKFYMEQRIENVLKDRKEREQRREQLELEMQRVQLSEDAQSEMRKILSQKESNYIRLKRSKMDPSMFHKIKKIGVGAFGEVVLTKHNQTLYAMKILKKAEVLKRNQVAHVKAERDILAEADNEWVVKLFYSFQDKENLYFVMEYVPGGDLMSLLIKKSIFPEDMARFYIAELVLAIESVHRMGFIHRDIKPDNVLIDSDGHIKLTDFGLCTGFRWTHDSKYYQCVTLPHGHNREPSFDIDNNWAKEHKCRCGHVLDGQTPLSRRHARQHLRCQAHSLVGTPNYIAPEVLMRIPYTHLCDWWSVGVILYEMLVGRPPFYASNAADTQMRVINWENTLHIPLKLSSEAENLILRLCTSANKRIGAGGTDDIKNHPFFHGIDWVMIRRTKACYVPNIKHPEDTSNFDPVEPERQPGSDCESMTDVSDSGSCRSHPPHAFYEFTYRRFFTQDQARSSVSNYSSWDGTESEDGKAPVYV